MLEKIKEYAGIITIIISIISSVVGGIIWVKQKLQQDNEQLECIILQNVALVQNQIPATNWEIEIVKQHIKIEENERKLAEITRVSENSGFIRQITAEINNAGITIDKYYAAKKKHLDAMDKIQNDMVMRNCKEYVL
jgi:hypothetical protein